MGYSETTTYINSSVESVMTELSKFLGEEGFILVGRPTKRRPETYDLMQYGEPEVNNLWAFSVFSGADGWTIIKSAPPDTLGGVGKSDDTMRLSKLCELLKVSGFTYHVYDGSNELLVESNGRGKILISGFLPSATPLLYSGYEIKEEDINVQFKSLQLHNLLEEAEILCR